jgi:hypothetical protein
MERHSSYVRIFRGFCYIIHELKSSNEKRTKAPEVLVFADNLYLVETYLHELSFVYFSSLYLYILIWLFDWHLKYYT